MSPICTEPSSSRSCNKLNAVPTMQVTRQQATLTPLPITLKHMLFLSGPGANPPPTKRIAVHTDMRVRAQRKQHATIHLLPIINTNKVPQWQAGQVE